MTQTRNIYLHMKSLCFTDIHGIQFKNSILKVKIKQECTSILGTKDSLDPQKHGIICTL